MILISIAFIKIRLWWRVACNFRYYGSENHQFCRINTINL